MTTRVKPIAALASGIFAWTCVLCTPAQAQTTLVSYGTSTLADVFLTSSGSEALSVSWFVVENSSASGNVYTYSYNVNNPSGDDVLNNNGTPTTTPETFDTFSLTFNASIPGAIISATAPLNGSWANNGANGVMWTFPDVSPGSSSPLLAFQSALPPVLGNAGAGGGAIPPAPWSSVPAGTPVAVPAPKAVPEPGTMALMVVAALALVPFRSSIARLFGRA